MPFTFPEDVDGWLLPDEGRCLYDWAAGKRVLEIGSYCGKSTICLAQSATEVVSVDPHDGRGLGGKQTYREMEQNLIAYGLRGKVRMFVGLSGEVPLTGKFDGGFIDGCHTAVAVRRDIAVVEAVLADEGEIAFHDYWQGDIGVVVAVDEYVARGAEPLDQVERVAILMPPKQGSYLCKKS